MYSSDASLRSFLSYNAHLCSRNLAIRIEQILSECKAQRPRPCARHATTFSDGSFESPILRTYVDRVGRSVRAHRVASVLSSPRSSKLIHIFAGWHTRHSAYGFLQLLWNHGGSTLSLSSCMVCRDKATMMFRGLESRATRA